MTTSSDVSLRLNSIWALKNLLYQADSATKDLVMTTLTYDRLRKYVLFFLFHYFFFFASLCLTPLLHLSFLSDPDNGIQEQALTMLRNLACCKENEAVRDIENIFHGVGEELIPLLESKLEGQPRDTVQQAIYLLVNLATGDEGHKLQLMQSDTLLGKILAFMDHPDSSLRVVATWFVINLVWTDESGNQGGGRVRRLREAGFEEKLRAMQNDPELDVRDRVKTALESFDRERKMEF